LYTAAYLAAGTLLLYTHYYGLPVIIAQNIYCFTQYMRRRRPGLLSLTKWLKLQLLLLLLFLPVSVLMLKQGSAISKGFWITKPLFSDVFSYFMTYSGSAPILIILLIFSLLAIVGLPAAGYLGRVFQVPGDNPAVLQISYGSRLYLLLLWILSVILIPFLVSVTVTPILVYRYTIGASPVLYLLASRGITGTNNNRVIMVLAALITVFSLANVEEKYTTIDKFQWREAVAAIEAEAGYGDIMSVYPQFELEPVRYYSKRRDILKGPLGFDFFSASEARDKNIWVIISTHWGIDKEAMIEELEKKYDLVSRMKFAYIDVYKMRLKTGMKTTSLTP
ncbi:MAG TPA: hypothetical protein VHC46_10160, partial [Thermodesulfobacteriota bacterium]|nr:hypothetical protein [Thermodesulfobacteriota bacterium]